MDTILHIRFMRHGRSQADDDEIHEGRHDSPLTVNGRTQAYERSEFFLSKKVTFDKIISSPLLRAKETADIVASTLKMHSPVECDGLWMERDNGLLAGLSRKLAAEQFPPPQFRTPYTPHGRTGESEWSLFCRAAEAVQNLVRRGPGSYLVVAHGGILNAALRTIFAASPQSSGNNASFSFGDCGFATLTYNASTHHWRLTGLQSGE